MKPSKSGKKGVFDKSDKKGDLSNSSKGLQMKKRKRFHSLPLKTFKVTCPKISKIISKVCDNIFEDTVLNTNINSSMIKLRTTLNYMNLLINEDSNKKKNTKAALKDSHSFQKEKTKNEEDGEEEFFPKPRVHRKSFIFNNILKIKTIKCPKLLEEQWKYEKILLDYNIIDFTSKK
jgi:hypothetical protein